MCDSQVVDLIVDIVTRKCQAGDLFTAYDISREVQVEEKAAGIPFTRHAEIREDVLDAIQPFLQQNGGNYVSILLPIANPNPRLFFPDGSDTNTYIPFGETQPLNLYSLATPALQIQNGVLQPLPVDDDQDISQQDISQVLGFPVMKVNGRNCNEFCRVYPDHTEFENRSPDSRGTLCVPAVLLGNAGFKPGDKVMVLATTSTRQPMQGNPVLVLIKPSSDEEIAIGLPAAAASVHRKFRRCVRPPLRRVQAGWEARFPRAGKCPESRRACAAW
jgi:hypothetical protein